MMKVAMVCLLFSATLPSNPRHLALEKSAWLGLSNKTHEILHTRQNIALSLLKGQHNSYPLFKQSFSTCLKIMAEDNKGAKPPHEQATQPLPRSYNELVGGNQPKKTSWPELVGVTAEEAERKIKEEMAGAEIQVVPPDHFVTADFRPQRVRLYVDKTHKIIRTPGIG